MWVYSRSAALKFPELVPEFRFFNFDSPLSLFLPSEDILLALALMELRNVKHSSWCNWNGKYQLISRHFLPNKSVSQIRNHLKNIRSHPSPSPVQVIVSNAEKGHSVIEYHNNTCLPPQSEIPLRWQKNFQPLWLQALSDVFQQGLIQIVNREDEEPSSNDIAQNPIEVNNSASSIKEKSVDKIHLRRRVPFSETSKLSSPKISLIGPTGPDSFTPKPFKHTTVGGTEHENEREEIVITEETSNSNDKFCSASSVQKHSSIVVNKSKRIQRIQRGLHSLYDKSLREQTFCALLGAIIEDTNQRLFIHRDKLRSIQVDKFYRNQKQFFLGDYNKQRFNLC